MLQLIEQREAELSCEVANGLLARRTVHRKAELRHLGRKAAEFTNEGGPGTANGGVVERGFRHVGSPEKMETSFRNGTSTQVAACPRRVPMDANVAGIRRC